MCLCVLQRCVDRLKNSRSRLLERYRQAGESQQPGGSGASAIVQEVMEEEWTALQSEDRRLPSLWGPHGMAEVGLSLSVSVLLYTRVSLPISKSVSLLLCFPEDTKLKYLQIARHLFNKTFSFHNKWRHVFLFFFFL